MSYVKKALRGFALVFGFSLIASFLGYLFKIVMARNLSVEDYGLFFAIYIFYWFLQYFRDFGVSQALGKLLPEFLAKKKEKLVRNSVTSSYIFEFILTIIIVAVVLLSSNWLATYYFKNAFAANLLRWFALVYVLRMFTNLSLFVLQGFQKMFSYSLVLFFEKFFIIISLVLVFIFDKSVLFAIYAMILAYLALVVVTYIMTFKNLKKGKFSKPTIRKLLRFGFPLFLSSLASLIYLYTDTLFLTYFRSLAEVGVYDVVVSSAMILNFVGTSTAVVMLPLLSEMIAKKLNLELKKGLLLSYKYLMFVALPPALIFLTFPKLFIKLLFGAKYVSGFLTLQILIIGVFFLVLTSLAIQLIVAANKPKFVTKITVGAAILNLILNFIFIPRYGLVAAASTSTICYIFLFMSSQFYSKKLLGMSLPYLNWIKILVSGALFLVTVYVLKTYLSLPVIPEAIITIAVAGLIYLLANLLLRSITINDFKYVLKNLR